jgi:hypothetical protein
VPAWIEAVLTKANGTENVKYHLHDFPFLGMVCRSLHIFCFLACFEWDLFWLSNIQIKNFLCVFNIFLDALPMILLSCSNSILVKS